MNMFMCGCQPRVNCEADFAGKFANDLPSLILPGEL